MGIKAYFRTSIVGLIAASVIVGGMSAGAGTAAACTATPHSHELASTLPQLRPGTTGKQVVGLQLALRNAGHQLQGTGFYGTKTLAAVRDFQRRNGIKESGIVGSKTWHALVGRKALSQTSGLGKLPSFSVYPGETNRDKVAMVGNVLGRLYSNWHESTSYSPAMVADVQRFQRSVGIKASGIVGPKTWAAMNDVVRISGGWGC
jgi:peptidoglycan hydrolase-like protein with peptidoglycan-binding domain